MNHEISLFCELLQCISKHSENINDREKSSVYKEKIEMAVNKGFFFESEDIIHDIILFMGDDIRLIIDFLPTFENLSFNQIRPSDYFAYNWIFVEAVEIMNSLKHDNV